MSDEAERVAWLEGQSLAGYAAESADCVSSDRPDLHHRPDSIPAAVGQALAGLHALDPSTCPFAHRHGDLMAEITAAVEQGRIDTGLLPAPYDRYPPQELLAMLGDHMPTDHRAGADRAPDLVVGHGAPRLAHIWLQPGADPVRFRFSGLRRLGLADRHADLAIVHRQLNDAYGPEAVFAFYEGYGSQPQLVPLDHYLLIDVLHSAILDEGTVDDVTVDGGTIEEGTIDEGTVDDVTVDGGTIEEGTIDEGTFDEGTVEPGGRP